MGGMKFEVSGKDWNCRREKKCFFLFFSTMKMEENFIIFFSQSMVWFSYRLPIGYGRKWKKEVDIKEKSSIVDRLDTF